MAGKGDRAGQDPRRSFRRQDPRRVFPDRRRSRGSPGAREAVVRRGGAVGKFRDGPEPAAAPRIHDGGRLPETGGDDVPVHGGDAAIPSAPPGRDASGRRLLSRHAQADPPRLSAGGEGGGGSPDDGVPGAVPPEPGLLGRLGGGGTGEERAPRS